MGPGHRGEGGRLRPRIAVASGDGNIEGRGFWRGRRIGRHGNPCKCPEEDCAADREPGLCRLKHLGISFRAAAGCSHGSPNPEEGQYSKGTPSAKPRALGTWRRCSRAHGAVPEGRSSFIIGNVRDRNESWSDRIQGWFLQRSFMKNV